MTEVQHPLPIGTIIKVNIKSWDNGVMSWDDSDTEIERVAEPGSECHIWDIEQGSDGPRYHATFIPSEVWNILEPEDFTNKPENFEIVELGTGEMSARYHAYFDDEDRPRDPEAVRKIGEELSKDGPAL
jgi:hypothetical protein